MARPIPDDAPVTAMTAPEIPRKSSDNGCGHERLEIGDSLRLRQLVCIDRHAAALIYFGNKGEVRKRVPVECIQIVRESDLIDLKDFRNHLQQCHFIHACILPMAFPAPAPMLPLDRARVSKIIPMLSSALDASAVAAGLGAAVLGDNLSIVAPAAIQTASAGSLTFAVDTERYAPQLDAALRAGAVVIAPVGTALPPQSPGALILVENPRAAFAFAVAQHFTEALVPGIAETARVHPRATVDPTAIIGEYTVVRAGASIGAGTEVRDHVVVGTGVVIGANTLIKSHAVIGEEGFGIEKDPAGNNFRIPHVGSVHIGDHVEVGCFTTVCAGTVSPTTIGDYSKIDDHVHVAHNCLIGRNVIVTACAEISGSVIVEDGAWIGPNASVIQGVVIGKGALLGIGATAIRSVPEYEVRAGNPAKRIGDMPR